MKKSELCRQAAEKAGLPYSEMNEALDAIISVLRNAFAKGEKVCLNGFVSFEPYIAKARYARDLYNGKAVEIPARRRIKLKLSTKTSIFISEGIQ